MGGWFLCVSFSIQTMKSLQASHVIKTSDSQLVADSWCKQVWINVQYQCYQNTSNHECRCWYYKSFFCSRQEVGDKARCCSQSGPGWTLNSLIYATLKVNFSALVLKLWFYFERILSHTREEKVTLKTVCGKMKYYLKLKCGLFLRQAGISVYVLHVLVTCRFPQQGGRSRGRRSGVMPHETLTGVWVSV